MMRIIQTRVNRIQNLFFPIECIVCYAPGSYLCKKHEKNLYGLYGQCPFCFVPVDSGRCCPEHANQDLVGVVVVFLYTRLIKHMIGMAKRGKYEIFEYLAPKLVREIQQSLCVGTEGEIYDKKKIALVPVPLHWIKKRYVRGYNQSEKLAEYVGVYSGMNVYMLIKKKKRTKQQHDLSRADRKKHGEENYEFDWKVYEQKKGELKGVTTFILVDDILTTGTTLHSCAKVLKKHLPSAVVWGACVAKH